MTKTELIDLLKSLDVSVNEGVPTDETVEDSERICFWEYLWEDISASGQEYNTKVTYQISVLAEKPRCETLITLKNKINELNIFPIIQHEYDIETRRWHSFFSLEVLENV